MNACSLLHILPLLKILGKTEILIFLHTRASPPSLVGSTAQLCVAYMLTILTFSYSIHPICGQTFSSH